MPPLVQLPFYTVAGALGNLSYRLGMSDAASLNSSASATPTGTSTKGTGKTRGAGDIAQNSLLQTSPHSKSAAAGLDNKRVAKRPSSSDIKRSMSEHKRHRVDTGSPNRMLTARDLLINSHPQGKAISQLPQVSGNEHDVSMLLLASQNFRSSQSFQGNSTVASFNSSGELSALRNNAQLRELAHELSKREQAANTANALINLSGSSSNLFGSLLQGNPQSRTTSAINLSNLSSIGLPINASLPFPPTQPSRFHSSGQYLANPSNFGAYPSSSNFGSGLGTHSLPSNSFWMPPTLQTGPVQSQSLPSLLLQLHNAQAASVTRPPSFLAAFQNLQRPIEPTRITGAPASQSFTTAQSTVATTQANRDTLPIFPCDEDRVTPFSDRPIFKLGMEEDPNWLSEFHCFVRSDLIEVFRASQEDCKARNNAIVHHQVGIRCRFCAHISSNARAGRSSAFPSSLRQIYQSFTMMLRDHFGSCEAMPRATQNKFRALKDKPSQGATDSKRYWVYSAMKIGLADSKKGIIVNEQSRSQGLAAPAFGTSPEQRAADDAVKDVPLVMESDRTLISEFLFLLMSESQMVRLTEAERVGNRRSLPLGLPGFGCRHCCQNQRLGLCRMFPARRRTLPSKAGDLYDHLRRCTVCPVQVKETLESLQHQMNTELHADQGGDREFFDLVWNRLGHIKP